MDTRLIIIVAAVVLGGCTSTPVHVPPTAAELCAPWKPILPSRQDVLTDATARQMLDRNETGARIGCWPAPAQQEK